MSKVKTYVGSDGKLHFTDASGADTALNFSSGLKFLEVGIFEFNLSPSQDVTLSVNFKNKYAEPPKVIFFGGFIPETDDYFQYWGLIPYLQSHIVHEMGNPTTTGFSIRCKNTNTSVSMGGSTIYACMTYDDWKNFAQNIS